MLQVYTATGNGTAGGLAWQTQVDGDAEEMLQVSWQLLASESTPLNAYEHWHCSGWRQWQLVVHRESGAREQVLMRVRSPLLLDALERVQEAAQRRGVAPTFVQVGAMDGVGHDHLHPFISSGRWNGLLIEPLKDYFDRLVGHYASAGDRLQFANMCVAEQAGRRVMRRLDPAALPTDLLHSLGYDGSSSLLADSRGLPPGVALSFDSLAAGTQEQVLAGMVEEEVECAPLLEILEAHRMCSQQCRQGGGASRGSRCGGTGCAFDVFASDTEGYDLKILQQLLVPPERESGRSGGWSEGWSEGGRSEGGTDQWSEGGTDQWSEGGTDQWSEGGTDHAPLRLPAVVFMEVGLLPHADQAAAAALLQAHGYEARRCGYGMELLGTRPALLA
eukprot:Tamp_05580.p1 GENE.Tamp_05580~~Tamp_05580.p1  ORF type:complete len:455 (+),score=100.04 Tamp_05580:199-1365(+)